MRRALYKDIDPGALIEMRNGGMSNAQIAKTLGVSYSTILGMIGKQPHGMRACAAKTGGVEAVEEREACLTIKRPGIEMIGNKFKYAAVLGGTEIEIQFSEAKEDFFCVPLEDIPQIIKELQAIVRNADKITGGNGLEVW